MVRPQKRSDPYMHAHVQPRMTLRCCEQAVLHINISSAMTVERVRGGGLLLVRSVAGLLPEGLHKGVAHYVLKCLDVVTIGIIVQCVGSLFDGRGSGGGAGYVHSLPYIAEELCHGI